MACLNLTLTHCKVQSQCHTHVDYEYLGNGNRLEHVTIAIKQEVISSCCIQLVCWNSASSKFSLSFYYRMA